MTIKEFAKLVNHYCHIENLERASGMVELYNLEHGTNFCIKALRLTCKAKWVKGGEKRYREYDVSSWADDFDNGNMQIKTW